MGKKRKAILLAVTVLLIALAGCGYDEDRDGASGAGAEPGAVPKAFLPGAYMDDGLFYRGYQRAYRQLVTMSWEEKAGQVLLARCPEVNGVSEAAAYHLGGYVLFRRDFQNRTKDQVAAQMMDYRNAGAIALVLAVDEEGGTVARISTNRELRSAVFPSPGQLYAIGGLVAIVEDSQEKAALLRELNIDVLLAPVADISVSAADYMYPRTLGAGVEETSLFVSTVVETLQAQQISSTLKHFPGYGNNLDTHGQAAVDRRPWSQFESEDLRPFQAGIEAGVHCILVSHNIIEALEPGVPASLSPRATEVLRQEMGFTGVIMTDDLVMTGVSSLREGAEPVIEALKSGKDMLIVSDYQKAWQDIMTALEEGTLPEEILDQAVFRILAWKYHKGLQ